MKTAGEFFVTVGTADYRKGAKNGNIFVDRLGSFIS